MIRTNIVVVFILIIALIFLFLQTTVFAKPTGTFETSIIDKREQNTVIYTGVFIPMKIYILETTELQQLNVKKQVYDRVNVGDRVNVTRYSNGRYRLQG